MSRDKKKPGTTTYKSWVHFLAGGAGGMAGAILTSPLDVVKTRFQSDFYHAKIAALRSEQEALQSSRQTKGVISAGARHLRETLQVLVDVYRVEGPRALFKGLGANLVGVVPARSINFYAYGNGKKLISSYFTEGRETPVVHLAAAAIAGIITSTATNPIWLVKTRLQLDKESGGRRRYRNSLDCVRQVVRQEGVVGLYRGLSASYIGVSESTIQWVAYEWLKRTFSGEESGSSSPVSKWMGKFGAAGVAKLFAAVLTYPHEVVRTRLRQVAGEGQARKYTGLIQCIKVIWKEEGYSAFYGGLTPHLMRVVPNAIVLFGTYEVILHAYGMD